MAGRKAYFVFTILEKNRDLKKIIYNAHILMTVTHQIFSIIFVFDVRKELWSPCTIGWITLTVKCILCGRRRNQ